MGYFWSVEGDVTLDTQAYVRLKNGDKPELTDEQFDKFLMRQNGDVIFRQTGIPAYQRSAIGKTNAGTSVTPTFGAGSATAGDLLIVTVAAVDAGATQTFSTSGYVSMGGIVRLGGISTQTYVKIATGGETAATVTITGANTELIAMLFNFSGFEGYVNKDLFQSNSGTSTSPSFTEPNTPIEANELMVMSVVNELAATQSSPTNSFVNRLEDTTTSLRMAVYDKNVVDQVAPSSTVTLSASQDWIVRNHTFTPNRTLLGIDSSEGAARMHGGLILMELNDTPASPTSPGSSVNDDKVARLYLREHTTTGSKSELVIQWQTGTVEVIKQET